MSSTAAAFATEVSPVERLEVLFEELAELSGQRNAIDARVVADRGRARPRRTVRCHRRPVGCGVGGLEDSARHRHNATTDRHRRPPAPEFPRCAQGMAEGRFSLDQIGVIAHGAADGSDAHYAELAAVATVSQLRTAVKLEPRPNPNPDPAAAALDHQDQRPSSRPPGGSPCPTPKPPPSTPPCSRTRTPLVAQWKRDHADADAGPVSEQTSTVPGCGRGVHEPDRGRLGHRGHPPSARAAHHRDRARRPRAPTPAHCTWDRCCPTTSAAT